MAAVLLQRKSCFAWRAPSSGCRQNLPQIRRPIKMPTRHRRVFYTKSLPANWLYLCGGFEVEGGVPLLGSGLLAGFAVLPGLSADAGDDFSFLGLIVSLFTSFLLPA